MQGRDPKLDLAELTTESRNPNTLEIDRLPTLEAARLMNAEDQLVAEAVKSELPRIAAAVDLIASCFRAGGRLFYVGAGTSGRLAVLDASECPPTFGVAPEMVQGIIAGGSSALTSSSEATEDSEEAGAADMVAAGVAEGDVVVGIAGSGRTPYVLGALGKAKEIGAHTVGLTSNRPSAMDDLVEICIAPVTGPEVIQGSTRLKAGTAVKLVLNMLSTLAMIKIGKTYGNLMVDLRASNEKLVDRAQRIVAQATGVPPAAAARALSVCENQAKVAIVMLKAGVSPREARSLLDRADNFVRKALKLAGVGE